MKKFFGKLSILFFAMLLVIGLASCTDTTETVNIDATVDGITIDSTTIPTDAVAGNLDYSSIKVIAHWNNGTVTTIDLTYDMIAVDDRAKLEKAGQHQLTVIYNKTTTEFQIYLNAKAAEKFTLTVEGGVPTAIDGVTLTEVPSLTNGSYTAEYTAGTVVSVTWIRVDGYEFSHWTDYDITQDTDSTTNITMNAAHSYKAVTNAMVSVVNFYTNGATVATIAPKSTNILNKSDINNGNDLSREDYVFDGWTTTVVANGTEINCTATKITFPYAVEIETTLYATWRPLGITYRQQEGEVGYIVTEYDLSYISDILTAPTTLDIPSKYQGYNVTGIDADAFTSDVAAMLQYINIPATVTTIADGAFRNCTQLLAITVASSSTKFEALDGVLYGYGLEKLVAYPSAKIAKEYNIQTTVTQIASYAFKDALLGRISCSNVVTIGDSAFASTHVDSIDLSSVVVSASSVFGSGIFDSNLRAVLVSSSYLSWFTGSSSLTAFAGIQDIITTDRTVITNVEVGVNTAKTMLYRIVSSKVEIIGVARNLTAFTVSPKLNGRNIFSLGVKAFNYCVYLSTITVPSDTNLERVGEDAFSDTPWLAKSIINDCIILNTVLYKYLGEATSFSVPSGVTKIAEGAFYGNNTITSLSMTENNTLSFIGAYAFYNCKKLSGNLEFMSNVVTVSDYAFANTKIENVLLRDNSVLATIGENAYANCYYLKSVEIGAYTTSIATTAFIYCYSIEEFDIQTASGVTPKYREYDGIIYKCNIYGVAEELFCYPAGKMMSIFDVGEPVIGTQLNIASIGDYSLFFSNIAAIKIPESIESISTIAIYIPGLTYVEFEAPLSNITYNIMFVADPLGIGKYTPDYVVFNIEDTTTNTPTITEDTNINSFYGNNTALKNSLNNYNSSHTIFGYMDEDNTLLYAFDTITPDIKVVRSSRTLSELIIPTSCTINTNLYYVHVIGEYAFYGYYLNKVTTGTNILEIENYAFYGANNLEVLDLKSSNAIPSIADQTFNSSFNNGLLIYIVAGSTDNYVDRWEASTKYLLESGYGIANFVTRSNEEWNTITYYDGTTWKTITSENYTEQNIVYGNYFPIPVRKGYIFAGWYDDSGVFLNLTLNYLIPYNIDLTASWEAEVYTIIFNVGAGVTMATKQISISYDMAFDYDTPTYPNKQFLYWRDSTGKTYGQSTDETYRIWKTNLDSSTLILYPVWEDVLYRIVYDSASLTGAVCDTTPVSVLYADDYTLAIPVKTGYVFQGWTLDPITAGVVPVLITDEYGVCLDFWSLNSSVQYTVYPYFIAESQITVTLVIGKNGSNEDIQYEVVTNVTFGQSFTFAYLAEKISDGAILAEYPVALFCGWVDSLGVKYTDDDGAGLYTWNVATDTTLYALWPIVIDTQAEFDAWLLTEDYLSGSIALGCDVTLTDPIGDRNNPYTGVFIGNGYTVTLNYTVLNSTSTNYDAYVGMVAYNRGTIKNVKLDANIVIQNTSSFNNDLYLGGVAGVNEGKITSTSSDALTDINVSIFVNFTSTSKFAYIGGIAGKNSGTISNLSCEINTITIQVSGVLFDGTNASNIIAGSIVGNVAGGSVNTRTAKFYYNDGTVILGSFGAVIASAVTSVNVTNTKIS